MFRALLFSAVLFSLPAYARLGETLDECVARYGDVVERKPSKTPGSDPDVCLFTKSGITIVAEFKAGKAWKILYRMSGMDSAAVQTLLSAEATGDGWSPAIKMGNQEVSISDDHDRIAIRQLTRRPEDMATLTFVTKAFAAANRADYETKLAMIPEELKRREEARPLKGL